MLLHILYTVVWSKYTASVKYAIGPVYRIETFGRFRDPGDASQEFQHAVLGDHEYLDAAVFESRVAELAEIYQRDLAAFKSWQEWVKG